MHTDRGEHTWGSENEGDTTYGYQDTISLKLDLTLGVLEAYKNGQSLGILSEEMQGPLCWACELFCRDDCAIILQSTSAPE